MPLSLSFLFFQYAPPFLFLSQLPSSRDLEQGDARSVAGEKRRSREKEREREREHDRESAVVAVFAAALSFFFVNFFFFDFFFFLLFTFSENSLQGLDRPQVGHQRRRVVPPLPVLHCFHD